MNRIYGEMPKYLGLFEVEPNEMMFYQYLPIKLPEMVEPILENRLDCFSEIIGAALCDFVADHGLERFHKSYVYLTAKFMYESKGCSFNRKGYHSDGFMTDDINYIWSDKKPTVFNFTKFNLTQDDSISIQEMEDQADEEKIETYPNNSLLKLDQFVIHRCSNVQTEGMRAFAKISISLEESQITTPHFHKFNENGIEIAYKTDKLLDPKESKALEDINLCIIHFFHESNTRLKDDDFPEIKIQSDTLGFKMTKEDPNQNIDFL